MEVGIVATRLLRASDELTARELAVGRAWYPAARVQVRHIALLRCLDAERLLYAAACLSPGLSWDATVETLVVLLDARANGATTFPRRGVHATFGFRPHEKAWRILTTPVDAASLATGLKVSAFAANLMGDLSRVTVDRHIAALAGVLPRGAKQVVQPTRHQQEVIAFAMAWAADRRSMQPAELQAAFWSHRAKVQATS